MGYIGSNNEALNSVRFDQLKKGRVYKGCDIIRITDRACVVKRSSGAYTIVGARGADGPNSAYIVGSYGLGDLTKAVLQGLVKIGAVTQSDIEEHTTRLKERNAARDREWAIESLTKSCETLGIPVPAFEGGER